MQVLVSEEQIAKVRQYMFCLTTSEDMTQWYVEDTARSYGAGMCSYNELEGRKQELELIRSELRAARRVLGLLGLYEGE